MAKYVPPWALLPPSTGRPLAPLRPYKRAKATGLAGEESIQSAEKGQNNLLLQDDAHLIFKVNPTDLLAMGMSTYFVEFARKFDSEMVKKTLDEHGSMLALPDMGSATTQYIAAGLLTTLSHDAHRKLVSQFTTTTNTVNLTEKEAAKFVGSLDYGNRAQVLDVVWEIVTRSESAELNLVYGKPVMLNSQTLSEVAMSSIAARMGVGVPLMSAGVSENKNKLQTELVIMWNNLSGSHLTMQYTAQTKLPDRVKMVAGLRRVVSVLGGLGITHLNVWEEAVVDMNDKMRRLYVKRYSALDAFPENGSALSSMFTLLGVLLDMRASDVYNNMSAEDMCKKTETKPLWLDLYGMAEAVAIDGTDNIKKVFTDSWDAIKALQDAPKSESGSTPNLKLPKLKSPKPAPGPQNVLPAQPAPGPQNVLPAQPAPGPQNVPSVTPLATENEKQSRVPLSFLDESDTGPRTPASNTDEETKQKQQDLVSEFRKTDFESSLGTKTLAQVKITIESEENKMVTNEGELAFNNGTLKLAEHKLDTTSKKINDSHGNSALDYIAEAEKAKLPDTEQQIIRLKETRDVLIRENGIIKNRIELAKKRENAIFDSRIQGMRDELIKLIGDLKKEFDALAQTLIQNNSREALDVINALNGLPAEAALDERIGDLKKKFNALVLKDTQNNPQEDKQTLTNEPFEMRRIAEDDERRRIQIAKAGAALDRIGRANRALLFDSRIQGMQNDEIIKLIDDLKREFGEFDALARQNNPQEALDVINALNGLPVKISEDEEKQETGIAEAEAALNKRTGDLKKKFNALVLKDTQNNPQAEDNEKREIQIAKAEAALDQIGRANRALLRLFSAIAMGKDRLPRVDINPADKEFEIRKKRTKLKRDVFLKKEKYGKEQLDSIKSLASTIKDKRESLKQFEKIPDTKQYKYLELTLTKLELLLTEKPGDQTIETRLKSLRKQKERHQTQQYAYLKDIARELEAEKKAEAEAEADPSIPNINDRLTSVRGKIKEIEDIVYDINEDDKQHTNLTKRYKTFINEQYVPKRNEFVNEMRELLEKYEEKLELEALDQLKHAISTYNKSTIVVTLSLNPVKGGLTNDAQEIIKNNININTWPRDPKVNWVKVVIGSATQVKVRITTSEPEADLKIVQDKVKTPPSATTWINKAADTNIVKGPQDAPESESRSNTPLRPPKLKLPWTVARVIEDPRDIGPDLLDLDLNPLDSETIVDTQRLALRGSATGVVFKVPKEKLESQLKAYADKITKRLMAKTLDFMTGLHVDKLPFNNLIDCVRLLAVGWLKVIAPQFAPPRLAPPPLAPPPLAPPPPAPPPPAPPAKKSDTRSFL